MKEDNRPYTTGEVASLCHVTINAVKKWIAAGKLEAFRTPGGHYRVKRDEFENFVTRYKLHIHEELFTKKRKILIIDDEPHIVEYVKGALELDGGDSYAIETAGDGYEALIKVGDFKPDLLILDIRMPRIDGFEVCRRLRLEETTKGIKILAMTAFGKDDMERIIQCGADRCLPKPLRVEKLRKDVERLLK
ncbi:MAG: response regulator [Thermodesulfobacteriota bacterium]